MMKKSITALFAFLAISCSLVVEEAPYKVELDCANPNIAPGGGTLRVNVICARNWTVSLDDTSWGKIQNIKTVDEVGGSLEVSVGVNPGAARKNILYVQSGSTVQKLEFLQSSVDALFYPASLTLSGTDAASVKFQCTESWTASTDAGWLSLGAEKGEGGEISLSVNATSLFLDKGTRTAEIDINIGGVTLHYPVSQNQTDVLYTGAESVELDYDGGAFEIGTSFNTGYKVSVSDSWVKIVETRSLDTGTVFFEADANGEITPRSAEITFSTESGDALASVSVSQEGLDPILLVTRPGAYNVAGKQYFYGSQAGVEMSRTVNSSGALTFRILYPSTVSMCSVSGLDGTEAKGDGKLLSVNVWESGKKVYEGEVGCTVKRVADGLVWLKSDDSYFVISSGL